MPEVASDATLRHSVPCEFKAAEFRFSQLNHYREIRLGVMGNDVFAFDNLQFQVVN